ncbi:MAG: RnfABCDGE type electron transport complex subunit B, partial [Clostridia bacterium]|nr:RnfABCDGE type electron transport complex subunit B [Clostridia bacterium]
MDPKILIPVGVVAAMGLICGIILAVASKLRAGMEDKLVKALRECLPGANCGACGYTGCDSYAKALSTGEKTNLCGPGAGTVAKKIADVLGVEAQSVVEMVAVVSCNGHCNATGPKQEYVGVQNCAAASLIYGGTGKCVFGCLAY